MICQVRSDLLHTLFSLTKGIFNQKDRIHFCFKIKPVQVSAKHIDSTQEAGNNFTIVLMTLSGCRHLCLLIYEYLYFPL